MKKNFLSNEKLIKRLVKGDPKAYTFLVDLYYKNLCDYASNLTRDDFESEDIVQNVFVRMWQQREKLNHSISIKNYLYKSVYNEFVDQYRKAIAVTALEKKYVEGVDLIFEERDESEIIRLMNIVEQEIEKLPTKCKETFLLNKKEGLTYIEIAEFQNVSVNTVEKQMSKAFSRIRQKVGNRTDILLFVLFNLRTKIF